jgi:hypothetical protein
LARGEGKWVGYPRGTYRFDAALLESRLGVIVPDVLVCKGERHLLVEFLVTHACDEVKIARTVAMDVVAIEIDLSGFPRDTSRADLEEAILTTAPRNWLNNSKLHAAQVKLERQDPMTVMSVESHDTPGRSSDATDAANPETDHYDDQVHWPRCTQGHHRGCRCGRRAQGRKVPFYGTIPNTSEAIRRLVSRLAGPGTALSFCYKAGACCQLTSWNENIGFMTALDIHSETNGPFDFSL